MTEESLDWTHEYTVTLPAEPPRVFRALTERGELERWFAEGVDVDARQGGAFGFWGKRTYGAPSRAEATQRITRFEKDRALGFTWDFDGAPTRVDMELTADGEKDGAASTKLTLRHAFPAKPAREWGTELVEDLWLLTLGNLSAHLRGGEGIVLPDYTDANPEIRLSIVIEAPRERVYRALIEPDALNRWIASKAEVDPRVGGTYRYGWTYQVGGRQVEGGPTKILDLVENERIVTDWPDWRGDASRGLTRVAWLLESLGPKKTRVTLVHGGFSRAADVGDYPFGWGHFMSQLKTEAER